MILFDFDAILLGFFVLFWDFAMDLNPPR